MRFSLVLVVVLLATMAMVGCGGGGGGGDKVPATSFSVTLTDHSTGFSHAGPVNLVILGNDGYNYHAELVRAVQQIDVISNSLAYFSCKIGKPVWVDGTGAGVFEVRITQGEAGVWHSGDMYDRWQINGDVAILLYGPPGSQVPGWTVWGLNTKTYFGTLADCGIKVDTYFISRGSDRKPPFSNDLTEAQMKANMATILAKIR